MEIGQMTSEELREAERMLSAWAKISLKARAGRPMWVAEKLISKMWANIRMTDAIALVAEVKKRGIASVREEIKNADGNDGKG